MPRKTYCAQCMQCLDADPEGGGFCHKCRAPLCRGCDCPFCDGEPDEWDVEDYPDDYGDWFDDAEILETGTPSNKFQNFIAIVIRLTLAALNIPYSKCDGSLATTTFTER